MGMLVEQSSVEMNKENVSGRISRHQDQRLPSDQKENFPRLVTRSKV